VSEFGAMFQEASSMLHDVLGESTKVVTYTPPITDALPTPSAQTLTKPIISSTNLTEPSATQQTGQHIFVAKSLTAKYSDITRLSNKGTITIDGTSYPILNMNVDETLDSINFSLDYTRRVTVSSPKFVRSV